jgi:glycosyltransferase involved in cell wall biosynthesis
MRVAIITSNNISINDNAKKGTEIFSYILIENLAKKIKEEKLNIHLTAFASGDSHLPVKIESVKYLASSNDHSIPDHKHTIFELALISKAFSMHKEFDIYHINIGDGDIALPFARFINKPVLITLHNTPQRKYINRYFPLFKNFKNVFFVSISKAQREFFPKLNYIDTVYHGIDTINNFKFDPRGENRIIWAGRAIPKKGMDTVIHVAARTNLATALYPLIKTDYRDWFDKQKEQIKLINERETIIHINKSIDRLSLVHQYQKSKLFLFPLKWEEPFGLVLIESMACGTPVIAYARGSVPEIVKDGETGFIINPSNHDRRGEWVIKKTGIEGLIEAVEKIYNMSEKEYMTMRANCRKHVEKYFAVDRMINDYVEVYKKAIEYSKL